MKRFRRWVFGFVALVSLVTCIGAIGMWVRSEWYGDRVTWDVTGAKQLRVQTTPGGAWVLVDVHAVDPNFPAGSPRLGGAEWGSPVFTLPGSIMGRRQVGTYQPDVMPWVHYGFGAWHEKWSDQHVQYAAAMPFWAIALVTAVLPVLAVRWVIRNRARGVSGRCRKCGYDLRATPERCPECGTVVVGKETRT